MPITRRGGAAGTSPEVPFAYVGARDGKIRVYSLDAATGALTPLQEVDAGQNPSFLAFSPDKRALYAADEGADQLASFAIDPASATLTPLNRVPSNGAAPTHVAVDAAGKYLFAANYGGGNVVMRAIRPDGGLGAEVTTLPTGANAHQVLIDATNRFAFVPNAGADTISQLVLDASAGSLASNAIPHVALPPGSGPRHMVFHPSAPYAYVIHETDDKITAFHYDPQTGTLAARIQVVSTLPFGVSGGANTGAEIAFDPSGTFLYASNRGHDSIAIHAVDRRTGTMTPLGHQPSGGKTPRHFSVDPRAGLLLVANQGSGTIVAFHIDRPTGALTQLATTPLPAAPTFVAVLYL